MASVHDVAAYILKKQGAMSTMKLQKLCYYSQGWSLAWDEKPLFREPLRAWANGPVVYELFDDHRGRFRVASWGKGDPKNLTKDERETVDAVLFAYGNLTGQQLSDKSHAERPWIEARAGMPAGTTSSAVIDLETMQDYFGAMAAAEADALAEANELDDDPAEW
jgi:uncharacterized phage-associated protein